PISGGSSTTIIASYPVPEPKATLSFFRYLKSFIGKGSGIYSVPVTADGVPMPQFQDGTHFPVRKNGWIDSCRLRSRSISPDISNSFSRGLKKRPYFDN